jgi:hypothetical protein
MLLRSYVASGITGSSVGAVEAWIEVDVSAAPA